MAGNSHLYANPIHYLGDIKVAGDSTPDRVSVSLGGLCSLVLTEPDAARQLLVAAVEALRILDPDSPVQLARDATAIARPGACRSCGAVTGLVSGSGGTYCLDAKECADRRWAAKAGVSS